MIIFMSPEENKTLGEKNLATFVATPVFGTQIQYPYVV